MSKCTPMPEDRGLIPTPPGYEDLLDEVCPIINEAIEALLNDTDNTDSINSILASTPSFDLGGQTNG